MDEHDDGEANALRTAAGRRKGRWKQVAGGMLAAEVALGMSPSWAESTTGVGPTATAQTRLAFKIVIPSMVLLDTRTGTMYSNDSKAVAVPGSFATSNVVRRDGVAGTSALRPVGIPRNSAGTRVVTRGLDDGEVFCVP